jgi:hypothetical protein
MTHSPPDDIYDEATRRHAIEQAKALREQARAGGLRFEAYLPPDLAEWLLDQIGRGVFVDPSEADHDREFFCVEGPMTDDRPWQGLNSAIWSLTPICARKFCADPVRPRSMIRALEFPTTRSRRDWSVSLRCRARSPPYGERVDDDEEERRQLPGHASLQPRVVDICGDRVVRIRHKRATALHVFIEYDLGDRIRRPVGMAPETPATTGVRSCAARRARIVTCSPPNIGRPTRSPAFRRGVS